MAVQTFTQSYEQTLCGLSDQSVQLIWTDPPFGTQKQFTLDSTWNAGRFSYRDVSPDELAAMLTVLFTEAQRVLSPDGVLALCLDYRNVHEAAVLGKANGLTFHGEIIWHFEMGGVSRSWWTNKHNTILLYASTDTPRFHLSQVPTTLRKAKRGDYQSDQRRVNSVWPLTFGPTDKERVGYPTQKPLALIKPFISVHTDPHDLVVDPFCGSGSVALAAQQLDRCAIVSDLNPHAVALTNQRLEEHP